MKALVYEGVETLVYRDVSEPESRAGEHLIRVEAVGICGSDMHAYLGHDNRRPAPLIRQPLLSTLQGFGFRVSGLGFRA